MTRKIQVDLITRALERRLKQQAIVDFKLASGRYQRCKLCGRPTTSRVQICGKHPRDADVARRGRQRTYASCLICGKKTFSKSKVCSKPEHNALKQRADRAIKKEPPIYTTCQLCGGRTRSKLAMCWKHRDSYDSVRKASYKKEKQEVPLVKICSGSISEWLGDLQPSQ